MSTRLSKPPAQLFIDDVLLPNWDPAGAVGYDPTQTPGDDAFLPVATSIANVGAVYPSLVVSYSNETSGGETTYDFMTTEGPGQQRDGQLVATARAEDERDYAGDPVTHSTVDAETIVDRLIAEVEDICLANATADGTEFSYLGSQRDADVPDDYDTTPPVRIADCTIAYGWDRRPEAP